MDPDPEFPAGERPPEMADPVDPPTQDEERFPWATWGPLGAVGATLLALFAGILATLPFFALSGLESGEDPEGATAIAMQAVTALGLALIPIAAAWSWSGGLLPGRERGRDGRESAINLALA